MPKKIFVHGFGSSSCKSEFGNAILADDARFDWIPDKGLMQISDDLAQKIREKKITHIVSSSFGAVLTTLAIMKVKLKIQHLSFYPVHDWNCISSTFFDQGVEKFPIDLVNKTKLKQNLNGYFMFDMQWNSLIVHPGFYDELKELLTYRIIAQKIVIGAKENMLDYSNIKNEISSEIQIIIDKEGSHDFETFLEMNQKLAQTFGRL
jgi:hypothetical protein